jgi:hypothetical protein
MHGHAITAWLSVLYRRIGSEAGFCQIGCGKASYLFIVLDLLTDILQRCVSYDRTVWVLCVRYMCENIIGNYCYYELLL